MNETELYEELVNVVDKEKAIARFVAKAVKRERARCLECVRDEPVPFYHKDFPEDSKVMIRTIIRTKKHIRKRILNQQQKVKD